jgi:hypothetical protein
MLGEIIAAVVGAVLAAWGTAWGTWWVSRYLDRQREARNLVGAIRVISNELRDNAQRIGVEELTIGDWNAMKAPFAGLALRDEPLWREVVDAYGQIFRSISTNGAENPQSGRLESLSADLAAQQEGLDREIKAFPATGVTRLWGRIRGADA